MKSKNQDLKIEGTISPQFFSQFLAVQNILHVFPSERGVCEFTAQFLRELPGVASCGICTRSQVELIGGLTTEKCKNCHPSLKIDHYECQLKTEKNIRCYPMKTSSGTYGFFILKVVDSKAHEPYVPYIENLANLIALTLESRFQKEKLEAGRKLLSSLAQAQNQFIAYSNPKQVFAELLDQLLLLTQSEYGFVGEVLCTPEGKNYLKSFVIKSISEKKAFTEFFEKNAPPGLEFHELDNLFGGVIKTGKAVISNNPSIDPQRGKHGLPSGHPPLNSYLGLPFHMGGKLLGMIGMANRPEGYDEELVEHLQPIMNACASIIEAYRVDKKRQEAEQALEESYAKLEMLVSERTAQLTATNESLRGEVFQRKKAEEELKKYQKQLELRVKERTAELEIARDAAESADRLKSLFMASMSHELRTPLNSIIGFTSILLDGMAGKINPKQKDYLGRAYRSSQHLLGLIGDIIDISQIESGRVEAFPELFDLHDVVDEAVGGTSVEQLKSKGIELMVFVPSKIEMYSDRKRVLQCVLNFLSNAVKFTESGSITISAREVGDEVEIMFEDSGIGISEADLPRLFRQFERLEVAYRTAKPGTGLGLYLTKKLATEVLGGSVGVESQLGVGSKFFLRLPKKFEKQKPEKGTIVLN